MDGLIGTLHGYAGTTMVGATGPLAVVATGGYGRGLLAPFSDIDLLFITPEQPSPATLAAVEFSLYFLWDLGLKVGHATRSVPECIAEAERDVTVRTSMIDARLTSRATPDAVRGVQRSVHGRLRAAHRRFHRGQAGGARRCGIGASAKARSWWSRISRKAAAACATCRPCTG